MLKKIISEVRSHLVIYVLLLLILSLGLFLRVYNIDNLLGFYYDQGRDALSIWNMWHEGDIPFIGPTTGIAGIFRGPYYFYLIAPFYLLGGGNPVWPSVFLSVTTVISSLILYYLGTKFQGRVTGLLAALISSFSFNIVMASRWLSNPTPMLLLSTLLILLMYMVTLGKKAAWVGISFVLGLSLFHFGSSGEAFYFPALLLFAIWQRKNLPTRKILLVSIMALLVTVLPLIAFDIKNDGLITTNVQKFLITDKSFAFPDARFVAGKVAFYYEVFTSKLFNARYHMEKFLLAGVLFAFIYHLRDLKKNVGVKIISLLIISVMVGLTFFQGNFGNIYDYYLTGYYLPFILLFAIVLGQLWKTKLGNIFVIYFLYIFFVNNTWVLKFKLLDSGMGPNSISFKGQKMAVDFIKADAVGRQFNIDVYVPPVIPYAYDYLIKWREVPQSPDQEETLYTLYEHDPPNPDRLQAWLDRQKGIGEVVETQKFGAITVERRKRFE